MAPTSSPFHTDPTVLITYLHGNWYPFVIFSSPVLHPFRLRHSSRSAGSSTLCMAPSHPPPPKRLEFASFTMASTSVSLVISRLITRIFIVLFFPLLSVSKNNISIWILLSFSIRFPYFHVPAKIPTSISGYTHREIPRSCVQTGP